MNDEPSPSQSTIQADGKPSLSRDEINALTQKIIGCAMAVQNELGCGFLEKVYENALCIELRRAGLEVQSQLPFQVRYRDQVVGEYIPDLIVAGSIIIELKAIKALDDIQAAQCMNYLKVTGLHVCLLFNFGLPRLQWKRIVHQFDETNTPALQRDPD
jgi:GxxExxY protein